MIMYLHNLRLPSIISGYISVLNSHVGLPAIVSPLCLMPCGYQGLPSTDMSWKSKRVKPAEGPYQRLSQISNT